MSGSGVLFGFVSLCFALCMTAGGASAKRRRTWEAGCWEEHLVEKDEQKLAFAWQQIRSGSFVTECAEVCGAVREVGPSHAFPESA